jgi:hypothetical protein
MHLVFKLPSAEEVGVIRHVVGLAKKRVPSEAELDRSCRVGFHSGDDQTAQKPASDDEAR